MPDEATATDDAGTKTDDAGKADEDGAKAQGDDKAKAGEGDDENKGAQAGEKSSTKIDIEELLDEYGLDSADDLKEFIGGLSEMKGKIGDHDLDALIENTKTLQQYQANWAQQEEEKKRESETPEQTIKRLEKEKNDLLSSSKKRENQQKAAQAAESALIDFGDTVETVIKSNKAIPKEYRPFVTEFMGVDNPINEVDISDKAAVRRLTKAGIAKIQAFEQAVIKRYRDGKVKLPKVTETETAAGDTGSKDKANPKNLKEAKAIVMQSFGALTGNR